jgi:hypothetical protein
MAFHKEIDMNIYTHNYTQEEINEMHELEWDAPQEHYIDQGYDYGVSDSDF